MGLFDGINAMKEFAKIKAGKTARLSISQITSMITNMPDARKNLKKSEFEAVHALYDELKKCNTKFEMNMDAYMDAAIKIIKRFDAIAPYEKYSGGNEMEFSFLMEEIRGESITSESSTSNKREKMVFDEKDKAYMRYVVESTSGKVNLEDAEGLIRIMYAYHERGKGEALQEFDKLAKAISEKYNWVEALVKIPYLAGMLSANDILSKEESDELAQKYIDLL
ncbi:MAG: hypothetical protein IJB30_02065 [Clostridia bacterium]|nr:hypothetical protein [Clostridia bacterium]